MIKQETMSQEYKNKIINMYIKIFGTLPPLELLCDIYNDDNIRLLRLAIKNHWPL